MSVTQTLGQRQGISPLHPAGGNGPSFVVLSTFPPTLCGLATFASALCSGLAEVGISRVGVIQAVDELTETNDSRIIGQLLSGSSESRIEAARAINAFDCLIIQHEFGIFGGCDGEEVLKLLDDVHIPVIVTLHTVPTAPSVNQRNILELISVKAQFLVTMTRVARDRLLKCYNVEGTKVFTIPHGAAVPHILKSPPVDETRLLTWGLLGAGKGIENVIDALALLPDLRDSVHYTIAGQTHPKIAASEGDRYRDMLRRRASVLGVSSMVSFDGAYRSLPALQGLIASSTCVILPYDSTEQITSGVLVDAVSAGRPVIATAFPHAVELLTGGVGIVVPHKDPVAIASAIRAVSSNPRLVESMAQATLPMAALHRWSAVAAQYVQLAFNNHSNDCLVF